MNSNTLVVQIESPIKDVFEYTTNPENTHLWISTIKKETRSSPYIDIGVEYLNESGKYIVSGFKLNNLFELASVNSPYRVRYEYKLLSNKNTELTYTEWHNDGSDLEVPLAQDSLIKLKNAIEKVG
jgi:hypothetical protein